MNTSEAAWAMEETAAARAVTVQDPEDGGLAGMLSDLVRQNLEQNPAKWADFRGLNLAVSISLSDAEVSVTLRFSRGALDVRADGAGRAHVRLSTTSDKVLALCALKVTGPLPRFFDPGGRALVKDILGGAVKIRGMLRHPVQLMRFTRLMSVNDLRTAR